MTMAPWYRATRACGWSAKPEELQEALNARRSEPAYYKYGLAVAGGSPESMTGEQQRRPTGISLTAGCGADAPWCCGTRTGAAASGSGRGTRGADASLVSSSSRFREGNMRIATIAPSTSSAAEIVKAKVYPRVAAIADAWEPAGSPVR